MSSRCTTASGGGLIAVTRTRHDDELDRADDLFGTAPGADFGEGVGADEEKQAVPGSQFAPDARDGADRIAARGARLQRRGGKRRFARARELDHPQPVFIRCNPGVGFVRRVGRRDEQDARERELRQRFAGHGYMGQMDGIERAAEDRDALTRRCAGFRPQPVIIQY